MSDIWKLNLHELMALQDYFAKKINPSEEDKARADRLDKYISRVADSIFEESTFRKLHGEGLVS